MINVKGIASYPRLNEPDTKFDADGVYNTKLILSAEDGEALNARLDALRAKKAADVREENNGKAPRLKDHPLNPEYDDDDNETGNWVLNCKMKASGKSKKTGKPWSRKVPLFDSQGNPTNVRVGGGSEIVCCIDPVAYVNKSKEKGKSVTNVGVSLRLEAVQVLKVSGASRGSSDFGFGKHEGGFEASPEDEQPTQTQESSEEESSEAESYDFS